MHRGYAQAPNQSYKSLILQESMEAAGVEPASYRVATRFSTSLAALMSRRGILAAAASHTPSPEEFTSTVPGRRWRLSAMNDTAIPYRASGSRTRSIVRRP